MIVKCKTREERFWSKVQKMSKDNCWEWTGFRNDNGYGYMQVYGKNIRPRKKIGAHRMSYIIHFGDIPKGFCICHKCDNRNCVNPNHLFLGTYNDNIQDMIKKGRAPWQKKLKKK